MIFHYFTKRWKWLYGRYAPSGIRVWRKTMENDEFEERPLSWKIVVRIKKHLFTKGSTNRWTWHLCNAIRSAKSIQIQPIIPNLINQRKSRKKTRIWVEISRIFLYIYIYICTYHGLTLSLLMHSWRDICLWMAQKGHTAHRSTNP